VPIDERSQTVTLSDGRRLGYTEFGSPEGKPVVFLHGTPGSRMFHLPRWLEPSIGLRIISPDRPGMGLSDPQSGRCLLDYPADVQELVDSLGITTFSVAGISGGGPHALACAYGLPDRIDVAVVISGGAPFDTPDALSGMHRGNRTAFWLARRVPWALGLMMAPNLLIARTFPGLYSKLAVKTLPESDQAVLADAELRESFIAGSQEAVRQGSRGVIKEAIIYTKPWGFSLSEIKVPVHLWHGDMDVNAPISMAERMVAEIPNATLHRCPGEGHLLVVKHWQEIEVVLLSSSR
jgi:pimeloyl-ACP methyl ester carboxylesterase